MASFNEPENQDSKTGFLRRGPKIPGNLAIFEMVFAGVSLKGDDTCVRLENVAQTDMGASQGRRMERGSQNHRIFGVGKDS